MTTRRAISVACSSPSASASAIAAAQRNTRRRPSRPRMASLSAAAGRSLHPTAPPRPANRRCRVAPAEPAPAWQTLVAPSSHGSSRTTDKVRSW